MTNPYAQLAEDAARDASKVTASSEVPAQSDPPPSRKAGWGCVVYGCLGVLLVGLLGTVIAAGTLFYVARGQLQEYTAEEPMPLPVEKTDPAEVVRIQKRIEIFSGAVEKSTKLPADIPPPDAEVDPAPAPKEVPRDPDSAVDQPKQLERELSLSAQELNTLIASNPTLRGRLYVSIAEGQIEGQVSIPTDGIPMAGGRFLNAVAKLTVRLENGVLKVHLVDAAVKGKRLPQFVLDALAEKNLAEDLQEDPQTARLISTLESVEVRGDRIVFRMRESALPRTEPTADAPAGKQVSRTESENGVPAGSEAQ
ncbi:hypothetical protein [Botrimarina hoheduenensis]|uniref:Uncharacterized protein n=1 Tax=Botrimarina hoheduenensis TaxID=2528000 RepID=A0A5C5WFI3_9BACT|nr:hypothetical protein [Botrimarina hoheduenensis]TWT48845.1 hypothetical protein Pla111_06210 [Botrimarina hoheduenensis]